MIRLILYLLSFLLLITVVRDLLKFVLRLMGAALNPARQKPPEAVAGGELKKDPVCGTFVSALTAPTKTVGGQTYYFCSTDCRDKFAAPRPNAVRTT